MSVTALHHDPLVSLWPTVRTMPDGLSLSDMAARMASLPDGWPRHGDDVICINGKPVPQALWGMVRPKPGRPGRPVQVTFHAPPMGGDEGGKEVITVLAAIALVVVSQGIVRGDILGGFTGASAGAATPLSLALAAGVSVLGSAALAAFSPSPVIEDPDDVARLGVASATGNVLSPNGAVPRVVGTHKIFPPLGAHPHVYFDNQDEVAEAVYVLAGPHKLEDIRIKDVTIDDIDGVTYQTREGWDGDDPITLLERQTRTTESREELVGHSTGDNGKTLDPETEDIEDALPQPKMVATRYQPDKLQMQFELPGGLWNIDQDTMLLRIPLRFRMRERGGAWVNLPEMHFLAASQDPLRFMVELRWGTHTSSAAVTADGKGLVEARVNSPGQTIAPATSDYDADSYFYDGSGGVQVTSTNTTTTGVKNILMDTYRAIVLLDTAIFPKGEYEVEVKRGYAFANSSYSTSGYTYAGQVRDFFHYQTSGGQYIYQSQQGYSSSIAMARAVNIWEEHPVQKPGLAIIAVRARNTDLEELSVKASGYVPDYDGANWTTWTTTSNPAPHYRHIWHGGLGAKRLQASMIDDAELVTWRTACTNAGYECNSILEGQTVADAARIVAAAGYAVPTKSETYGVSRDYDRSAESPVQIFGPHNSRNFAFRNALPDLPDALRIGYRDRDRNYEDRWIEVPRNPLNPGTDLIEEMRYEALVTEAQARARAEYDFTVSEKRSVVYTLEAGRDAIIARRGSLIGVQSDVLLASAGSGVIEEVFFDSSGNVTGVRLDNGVPGTEESRFAAMDDLLDLTSRLGVVIRRTDGTSSTHEVTAFATTSDTLTFSTPISATVGIEGGAMVLSGLLGEEYRRMIVTDMKPRDGGVWAVSMMREAPEIWS